MEDWRLNGQEKYLQGATFYKIVFPQFWLKAVTERNSFYDMIADRAHRFAEQMQRGVEYLEGDKLHQFFHEHCEFCMEKVTTDKECVFYCTTDMQHWVCSDCFNDFKELFAWKVEQYECESVYLAY